MSFHLAAYFESQAVVAAPSALNCVQDNYLPIQSPDAFMPNKNFRLYGGFAIGANMSRAQINTPIFRPIGPFEICPVNVGAAPLSAIHPLIKIDGAPMIPRVDPLQFLTDNGGGGAENQFGLIFLGDGVKSMSMEEIRTIHCTGACVAAAGTWASGVLTFGTQLPGGRYRVVGMDVFGTNVIAARLIAPESLLRPGCIGRATQIIQNDHTFRFGNLGAWCEFESTAPPTLEVLGGGVTATQIVRLDVQQIRIGA